MLISSKDNSQVKALKRLIHQPKRTDDLMVVEGVHACQLLLKHQSAKNEDMSVMRVWVGSSAMDNTEVQQLVRAVSAHGTPVIELTNAVFRDISSLEQGVSLIFEVSRPQLFGLPTELATRAITGNVVLLDGIQDPGNMGSIIRSCAAAGLTEIWLSEHCVNPYSAKVLRAGVGAHFGVTIRERIDLLAAVAQLKQANIHVCATSSHTTQSIYTHDLNRPIAWLMGNEGAGLSEVLLAQADERLTIPMALGESLNVAAATAVCLFEMVRQQAH